MNCHQYQSDACHNATEAGLLPILNAACKEDPGRLGHKWNATNLDIWDFDEQTKTPLKQIPNFVQGDVLKLGELFEPKSWGLVVLGEFLEHCVPAAAEAALKQIHTVLKDDGWLCLTFPLDSRPAHVQHGKHLLKVIVEGETGHDITVWHQTVWEEEMLEALLRDTGFKVKHKTALTYSFVRGRDPAGWGMLLTKG